MKNSILLANYHTHTARCNHASGTEEEYILRAIERGGKILGFSDHSTYLFSTSYYSNFRMKREEIDEYVASLRALREKYRDKIEILIGFEVEYYPELWENSLNEWRRAGIEYLVLGQHFKSNEEELEKKGNLKSVFFPHESENDLKNYVSHVVSAIKTGKISYIAHPDVINFTGDKKTYSQKMAEIIECAMEYDLPLEYNLLGLTRRRGYPVSDFWDMVSYYGAKVIIGCDAHTADDVMKPDAILLARENLKKHKITNIVEKIDLRPL